jgi:NADH:ubiquinone oxidoreductase subunit 3 (subunit A)
LRPALSLSPADEWPDSGVLFCELRQGARIFTKCFLSHRQPIHRAGGVIVSAVQDFFPVLVFLIVAVLFTLVPLALAHILAPRSRGEKTLSVYECGIEPFGGAWIRYRVTYYVYALIFIAFDVDILYLFPIALSYTKGGNMYEFWALLVFVLILALAMTYAWGKGVFTWKRKIQL